MASYIENERLTLYISLFVTTEIALIVGVMIQVYIIAVNVIEWRRGRAMSTSDQVIISIMVTRMILQSVIQLRLFWEVFCTMCSPIYLIFMQIIYYFTTYSSIWLSTLLCVVFYMKISNFRSVFFLWLQRLISKRILHFIIASLLLSLSQTIVYYLIKFSTNANFVPSNSTQTTPVNSAISVVYYLGIFGPLLIFLLSSLFLIASLYLHIRHMRCNRTVTSSLDAYYRIIKYMASSFFASILCAILTVLVEGYIPLFGSAVLSFPWTTFGSLHSMLLIYATPKLKSPLAKMLKYLSNCWIKREDSGELAMSLPDL